MPERMKEIKEIIEIGKKLDELTYEVYSNFAKRDDFDPGLLPCGQDGRMEKKSYKALEEDFKDLCLQEHPQEKTR